MAKATILQNYGEARYRIRIEYDFTQLDAEVTELADRITETDTLIFAKINERTTIKAELDVKLAELNAAIIASSGDPDLDTINPIVEEAARIRARMDAKSREIAALQAKKLSDSARHTQLQRRKNALSNEALDAWCADYSVGLGVGLVVPVCIVPGEKGGATITILPRDPDAISPPLLNLEGYDRSRDGQFVPTIAMTPAQAFYNYALLPGWQRWMPTYRHGTIVGTPSETHCNVTFDAANALAKPDGKKLNVNDDGTYNVEAIYMNCGASIFEAGDHVIVMFVANSTAGTMDRAQVGAASWTADNMRVIGFVEEPRECVGDFLPPSPENIREFEDYSLLITATTSTLINLTTEQCGDGTWRVSSASVTTTTTWSGTENVDIWEIEPEVIQTVDFLWSGTQQSIETMTENELGTDNTTKSYTRDLTVWGDYPFIGTVVVYDEEHSWNGTELPGDKSITYSLVTRRIHAVCPQTGDYVEEVRTYPQATSSIASGEETSLTHTATGQIVYRIVRADPEVADTESTPIAAPNIQMTVNPIGPTYDNTCVYITNPANNNGTTTGTASGSVTVSAVNPVNYPIVAGAACSPGLQDVYDALVGP